VQETRLQQPKLPHRVDLRHHDAAPGHDYHQPLTSQTLQSLPHRRAPDSQPTAQDRFRHHRAGRDPQGDDLLLQLAIGDIGQRLRVQEFVDILHACEGLARH
jgi:hypothetical protein